MSYTPNIGLMLTPADDTTTTFKQWRTGINGEGNDSNMTKIDDAIGTLNENYDTIQVKVARLEKEVEDLSVKTWADVQSIVRSGMAAQYFDVGDQLIVERLTNATASIGASTGIKSVTINTDTFAKNVNEIHAGEYTLTYNTKTKQWTDDDNKIIALANYGLVTTGTAANADQIIITVETEELAFDIIGFDHDTPTDTRYTHSMTLQMRNVLDGYYEFDASEATWYLDSSRYPNGLSAGTYCFAYPEDWGGGYKVFTLTQAVPAGGQIWYDDWDSTGVYTYTSPTAMTEIENVADITDSETPSGTELPSVWLNDYDNVTNDFNRAYGSGRWSESAIRQWLNSRDNAGAWWTPQTDFDRPPAYAATHDGFLKNLDPAFLSVIGDVEKKTQLSVTNGYGMESSTERFFLLSLAEVYGGAERSTDGADGTPYEYYGAGHSALKTPGTGTDKNRVKYNNAGSTVWWWLRTPYSGNGNHVRYVYNDGNIYDGLAANTHSVAPACVIV